MYSNLGLLIFRLLLLPLAALSYDPVDLEIYDLVEEVGIQNSFYSVLQIDQSASVSEVRRAYRKLSLVLHPDKNDSPDAETKFRQLVAINEILKDNEKRNKYDQVLKNGLPDWRQPIYYYRKVKKMGLAELAVLLLAVFTIGHYIVSWAVYLEKAFELEEIMAPIKKKREKKRGKGKFQDDNINNSSTSHILEQNFGYKKPTFANLLPFLIFKWMLAFIKNLPDTVREMIIKYKECKEKMKLEKEKQEIHEEVKEKPRPKKKQQIQLRDASEFEDELPVISPFQKSVYEDEITHQNKKSNMEWTEEDLSCLARAMAKFPGGIPGRWDRIALEIGRTVSEVTKKVKEMKTSVTINGSVTSGNTQSGFGISGKRGAFQISDDIITKAIESELNPKPVITVSPEDLYMTQDDIPEDYDLGISYQQQQEEEIEQYTQVRKRKVKTRPEQINEEGKEDTTEHQNTESEENQDSIKNKGMVEAEKENDKKADVILDVWSQVQQKCFETALAHVPKNRTDRWTHIARSVPGKSKEECIQRYKLLAEHIKKRKDQDSLK